MAISTFSGFNLCMIFFWHAVIMGSVTAAKSLSSFAMQKIWFASVMHCSAKCSSMICFDTFLSALAFLLVDFACDPGATFGSDLERLRASPELHGASRLDAGSDLSAFWPLSKGRLRFRQRP